MPTHLVQLEGEISLPEILADPIVQSVMAGDGITKEEVERLVGTVRGKLASIQSEARQARRLGLGAIALGE